MFGIFKSDPVKKYQKQYEQLLQDAMQAQRGGDIRLYSELSSEADRLYQKIKSFESASS